MTQVKFGHKIHRRLHREYVWACDRIKLALDGARCHVSTSVKARELQSVPSGFDAGFVSWLFHNYAHELPCLHRVRRLRLALGGQYDDFEGAVLFMMVRHLKPAIAFELGTCRGYSALYILTAMELNQRGHLFSFEMNMDSLKTARRAIEEEGLNHRVEFVAGDCQQTFFLKHREAGPIDLLSVDADHSYEFGKWWTLNLPAYVNGQGVIHVHDIPFKGSWQDFEPRVGFEEGIAVGEFLTERASEYEYFSNHMLSCDQDFQRQIAAWWHRPFQLSMDDHSPSLWIRRLGEAKGMAR